MGRRDVTLVSRLLFDLLGSKGQSEVLCADDRTVVSWKHECGCAYPQFWSPSGFS